MCVHKTYVCLTIEIVRPYKMTLNKCVFRISCEKVSNAHFFQYNASVLLLHVLYRNYML